MVTLIITRGGHEYWQARKTYPEAIVRDLGQAPKYLRGEKYDRISYTSYAQKSPLWNSHVVPGLTYHADQGALITCLDS